jgi:TonB family protein
MKYIYIILIYVFFTEAIYAQKIINGGSYSGNIYWSGTILINGDVTIMEDCKLTITPGTKLLFSANTDNLKNGVDKTRGELIVRGTLIARGSESRKIIFTSNSKTPQMGDWYGIRFIKAKSNAKVDYCIIEYAYNGISIKNSPITINNSEIRYNYYSGIQVDVKAKPKLIHNIVSENGYAGLLCELGASPVLTDNFITLNNIGVIIFSLSQPNLGNLAQGHNFNPGRNRILNNEKYAIYNHSRKAVFAQNNLWGTQTRKTILDKIFDGEDDQKFGRINFEPIYNQRKDPSKLDSFLLISQSAQKSKDEQLIQRIISNIESTNIANHQKGLNENSGTIKNSVIKKQVKNITPLYASLSADNHFSSQISVRNEKDIDSIDYKRVFLEPFIDDGKKNIIKRERLNLTQSLRKAIQPGSVRIKVVVALNGAVASAEVLKSMNNTVDSAVLDTVKKYKYKPGMVNGNPVQFSTTEVFRFE